MTTEENITSPGTAKSRGVEGKHRKRRRRAAHRIVKSTEAGLHTTCGQFIAAREARPVDVDATGTPYETEYYKCTACARMDALEAELNSDQALSLLSAAHLLTTREGKDQ